MTPEVRDIAIEGALMLLCVLLVLAFGWTLQKLAKWLERRRP